MLENIASRFQTVVLVGLVVLLSSVFILQFGGPQAQGCTAGGTAWAAKVDGETVTGGEVNAIYRAVRFDQRSQDEQRQRQYRRMVLNGLIDRTLLANEARRVGFDLDNDEVSEEFATKRLLYITLGRDGREGGAVVQDVSGGVEDRETGLFDPEIAERFIRHALQRTETDFLRWQSEEMLADRMRQTAMAAVTVSPAEIRDAYVSEKERATVAYARFSPAYYRDRVEPSAADLDAWIADNSEAVDEEYQRQRHRYTDLEPQVRARHVLLKVESDADEATKEAVRVRAAALRARALAGEDFAALARDNSEDTGSAPRGGDLGYNPRGRMVGPFDAAQFDMEVGDISELVETRFGFHIIQVVGKREGDVPEDEAKRELAEGLYKEARAGELAKEAATAALSRLEGGASPDELDAYLLRQDRGEPEPDPAAVEDEEEDAEDAEDDGPERSALAPQIRTPPPFGRTDNPVRGAFDSGPLVRAVFAVDMDAPYPEEPLQLGTEYVVFKVLERTEATEEDFTGEVRERLRAGLLRNKRAEALDAMLDALRTDAEAAGRIRINDFDLDVRVEGGGTVTSDPPGIDCGPDCGARFEYGTMLELEAEAEEGGRFLGWDGDCSGLSETCIVTVDNARSVRARFRPSQGSTGEGEGESAEDDADDAADDE